MTTTSKIPKDTKLMEKVKIEHPKPCSDEPVMKKLSKIGDSS